VEARPAVPELVAFPALSDAAQGLFDEFLIAMQKDAGSYTNESDIIELYDRLLKDIERKAQAEQNMEAFAELKRHVELMLDRDMEVDSSHGDMITGTMDEQGRYQLDDLTPGNWTLEVTLNFPSVPLQWWDYADVWRKKVDVTIPEFPAERKVETLQIPDIVLGFDKSERKGAER
jgi:hypothetical protein